MAAQYVALPNGVSERDFSAAVAEFRAALGDDSVYVDPEHLAAYGKIMLPVPDAEHAPSAAISPISVEQVQACVAICNKYRVPVWPISTGKNSATARRRPAIAARW